MTRPDLHRAQLVLDQLAHRRIAEAELDAVPCTENLVLEKVVVLEQTHLDAVLAEVFMPKGPSMAAVRYQRALPGSKEMS